MSSSPSEQQPASPQHHVTRTEDRVALRDKAGYSAGGMSYTLMGNAIGNLGNVVLNIGLGMNPFLVGLLMAIPRFVDALFDPLIGAWSDNCRSRWGRRKPFMVVGALGAGCFSWCSGGCQQLGARWGNFGISSLFPPSSTSSCPSSRFRGVRWVSP